jgi:hypothetical protein
MEVKKQQETKPLIPSKTRKPADAPNPRHKQDFNGLLDMAVTPPKQGR